LLVLTPRRSRRLGFGLLAGMQLVIALTGNYAYFNLLTIALCLLLLDDDALRRVVVPYRVEATARPGWARRMILIGAAVVTVPVSSVMFAASFRWLPPASDLIAPIADVISPFHSVNTYGLFAVMTPNRPEIIVEGSDDGAHWLAYEFKYKPGDVRRRPAWVAPHQPRLDWQMWFAALDPQSAQVWLGRLIARVLDGDAAVVRLLGPNPLPGRPRYARLAYYQYHFTSAAERAKTGAWWKREFVGYLTDTIGPGPPH